MNSSSETKALGLALLASSLALGGTLLAAIPIKKLAGSYSNLIEVAAPTPTPEIATPPGLTEQGHEFFTMSCADCHGLDARGDEGPDLHNLAISNARIAATIKKGVKGEMPTFAKKYDAAQISAIVAYLRALK